MAHTETHEQMLLYITLFRRALGRPYQKLIRTMHRRSWSFTGYDNNASYRH